MADTLAVDVNCEIVSLMRQGRTGTLAPVVLVCAMFVGCAGSNATSAVTGTTSTTAPPPVRSTSTTTPPPPSATSSPMPGTTPSQDGGDQTNTSIRAFTTDGAVIVLDNQTVYSVDIGDQTTVSGWSQGDHVAVASTDDAITNLTTGEKITVTSVGSSSDANLYANTGDHTQQTNSDDGSLVVLDDGSIWKVAPGDQATTSVWIDASSITVNEGSTGPAYELVNTTSQDAVHASYIGDE